MDIKINEFKKVITSPVIIGLLVLFIIFNSIKIIENSYFKDELKVLNKIVDRFGYKIDDEMINRFKEYYDEQIEELNNKIVREKNSKEYNSISEFYADHKYDIEEVYNKEEVEFIEELGIMEAYYNMIWEIDDFYSSIDIMERAESEILKYGLSGKAANIVRKQYEALNERFHQLVNNNEHKNLFFIGKVYKMHSLLFRNILKTIIFEIIILVVLITAYLVNYEFDNSTEYIVYSTKKGRDLILDKLQITMVSSILAATIILLTGLGLYFIVFDYSGLWNVPISSYYNRDYNFPYLSWWNMSFIQYLLFSIVLVYLITLLFNGIAFIIARAIKNTYFAFFVFAIIFGLFLTVPGMAPRDSITIFIGGFTPFFLIINPHMWFMESGAFTTFKHYELATVGIWALVLLALGVLSINKFKRQDI